MEFIVAFLNNSVLIILLALVASHQSLRHPRNKSFLIWGPIFGLSTVLAMMSPVILSSGAAIDFRHVILIMAGYIGGWSTAGFAVAIVALYRTITGAPDMVLAVAHLLVCGMIGCILSYIPEHKLKGYKFTVIFTVAFPLIFATVVFRLPARYIESWFLEPEAWLIVVVMQLVSIITLQCYFVLRRDFWKIGRAHV